MTVAMRRYGYENPNRISGMYYTASMSQRRALKT